MRALVYAHEHTRGYIILRKYSNFWLYQNYAEDFKNVGLNLILKVAVLWVMLYGLLEIG